MDNESKISRRDLLVTGGASTAGLILVAATPSHALATPVAEPATMQEEVSVTDSPTEAASALPGAIPSRGQAVDQLALHVGVELVPLVDTCQHGEVPDRLESARRLILRDLGFLTPMIMISDNVRLQPNEYDILLNGASVGTGNLFMGRLLAMNPGNVREPIDGHRCKDPAYGMPGLWIKEDFRQEATYRGYTVVNTATVIVTHFSKLIVEHAHELLQWSDLERMMADLREFHPRIVQEVHEYVPFADLVQVFRNLLEERVSIADRLSIVNAIVQKCRVTRNAETLTRYARQALRRSIIAKYCHPAFELSVIKLSKHYEELVESGISCTEDGGTVLDLDPSLAAAIITDIGKAITYFTEQPVLLCGWRIRYGLSRLIRQFVPELAVIAFSEVPAEITTKTLAEV